MTPDLYTILGIDPGQKGALVWLRGADPVAVEPMPASPKVGIDLGAVRDLLLEHGAHRVVVERAQAMPKQGVASTFSYARDYGGLLGLLTALRIPYETVPPRTWHRELVGARTGDPKARALQVVRERLPSLQVVLPRCRVPHEGVVDAACVALWGQRHA